MRCRCSLYFLRAIRRRARQCQACFDDYVDIARHRASIYNRTKLADMQSTQIKIAEASAKIDAAA